MLDDVTGSRRPGLPPPAGPAAARCWRSRCSAARVAAVGADDRRRRGGALTWVASRRPRRRRSCWRPAAAAARVPRRGARRGRRAAARRAAVRPRPRLLKPARWDELGTGLGRGAEALTGVRLPYIGRDPWPDVDGRLAGALLRLRSRRSWSPRRAPRPAASRSSRSRLLLVLAASPVTLGGARPLVSASPRGAHRLLSVAGAGAAAPRPRASRCSAACAGGALPLGAAADREEPWFDYRTFAEGLGPPAPVRFDWDHGYGPIDWPREGVELLRVKAAAPAVLEARDPRRLRRPRWATRGVPDPAARGRGRPGRTGRRSPEWTQRAGVRRGLRDDNVVGAGTLLDVEAARGRRPGAFCPASGRRPRARPRRLLPVRVPRAAPDAGRAARPPAARRGARATR